MTWSAAYRYVGHRTALLVLVCFLSTGCWDRIELDQRALVSAVGIDALPDAPKSGGMGGDQQSRPSRFRLSLEIPLLRALQTNGPQPLTPDLEKPAHVLVGEGRTPYVIERELASRLSRTIFWGHTKVVVIGEELARDIGFHPLMNFFTRDPRFDRRARVVVAEGEASRLLQAAVVSENLVGSHIAKIMEAGPATSRAPAIGIQQLDAAMYGRGNILLPRAVLSDQEIALSGAAIVKHGKMVGWLSDIETLWALFVRNEIRGTWLVVPDPEDQRQELVYNIQAASRSLGFRVHEGELHFDIVITTEGEILERLLHKPDLGVTPLREVEQMAAWAIETGVHELVRTLQEEYQVDVLGFDDHLSKRHPKLWEGLSDEWDDIGFPSSQVTVRVEARILYTGILE